MGVFRFMCKYSQIAHLLVSFVKPRAKHPFSQWMQHHEKSWSGVKKERDGWGGGVHTLICSLTSLLVGWCYADGSKDGLCGLCVL